VDESNWGKTIRSGKAYRIPFNEVENDDDHPPSTVPYRDDVLFVRHYESDYLAAYSRVIDYAHPGNKHWKEEIYRLAPGYSKLSPELKEEFCNSLIKWTSVKRRFLKQDADRFWFQVTDMNELSKYCHRELSMAFDPLLDSLLRQLDALENESYFGLFRGTAMHKKIAPNYLAYWEKTLLPQSKAEKATPSNSTVIMGKSSSIVSPWLRIQPLPALPKQSQIGEERYALPPEPVPTPPLPYVWLQEGDKVKAKYNCKGKKCCVEMSTIIAFCIIDLIKSPHSLLFAHNDSRQLVSWYNCECYIKRRWL
jgi:hypothetical protein